MAETVRDDLVRLGDGALLAEFVREGRQEAFARVVERHGAMVLRVCRSRLGNAADADDAAQAAFLALAQRAPSLTSAATVAGWLYQVAWHAASNAAKVAETRRRHEQEAARMNQERNAKPAEPLVQREVLYQGITALPEKYRLPLILHHLEGRSEEETAALLGLSVSATSVRLSRGREKLRARLARLGVGATAVALMAALAGEASAAVPEKFVASMTHMAASVVAGHAASTAASATAAALSNGALHMLFIAKVKLAAMVAAVVLLTGGVGVGTYLTVAAEPRPVAEPPAPRGEETPPASADGPRPAPAKIAFIRILSGGNANEVSDASVEPWVVEQMGRLGALTMQASSGWVQLTDTEAEVYSTEMGGRLIKAHVAARRDGRVVVRIDGFKIGKTPRDVEVDGESGHAVVKLTDYPGGNVFAAVRLVGPKAANASPGGEIVKGLQLVLLADKTECGPDGTVRFTIALLNRTQEPVKYLQYPQACGPYLRITGPDGERLQRVEDPRAPRASMPAPSIEHVKELAPGARWEHTAWVSWQVLNPPHEDRNLMGNVIRRYEGCGWDIRKPGRYTVVAEYGPNDYARKISEKEKVVVWDGVAASNAVILVVAAPAKPAADGSQAGQITEERARQIALDAATKEYPTWRRHHKAAAYGDVIRSIKRMDRCWVVVFSADSGRTAWGAYIEIDAQTGAVTAFRKHRGG